MTATRPIEVDGESHASIRFDWRARGHQSDLSNESPRFTLHCRRAADAFRGNDANAHAIAYAYFANDSRLTAIADVWTRDDMRTLAERIARGFSRAAADIQPGT